MREMPLDIGTIHFVGIGGIGMSGIAEILHNLGYKVRGSDIAASANVKRLEALGIEVAIGHAEGNLADAAVVVISSAVKADNPEVRAARAQLIPVVRRAEMLGELMRLKWSIAIGGTHGKTTTTSLIAAMLDGGGFDPTVINGGIINAYGTNARLGQGDWMVVEADESDGTFTRLPAVIAVVTNIDPEHLDFYGEFEAEKRAFEQFVTNIPFYGFAVLCVDHPEVQALISRVADRRIVTYGFSPQADVRAIEVETSTKGTRFIALLQDRVSGSSRMIRDVVLPMLGEHNIQNALAAIAVAHEMGMQDAQILGALARFTGVKRRFTRTGESGGVTVIDDYGHHPVEIAAVLKAARSAAGGHKVMAVVQPHRYTRLASLFREFCTCFNDADAVIVADVYAAGEAPIEGATKSALVDGLRERGHRRVIPLPGPDALPSLMTDITEPGDFIVCLGAGNITAWANALPGQMDALRARAALGVTPGGSVNGTARGGTARGGKGAKAR
jgi:UDP-N-acetylmuramate--alanine ligase